MRILKEKLKVRIRASGFNTINEGQLCCFVFLAQFVFDSTKHQWFLRFRSGWCWPIRVLPISIVLLSMLYAGVLFKGFLLCLVLFCFSSPFVFYSTKYPQFLLFRSGWCWPMSILYEHFGDKIPLQRKESRKKNVWWTMYLVPIFYTIFQFCP